MIRKIPSFSKPVNNTDGRQTQFENVKYIDVEARETMDGLHILITKKMPFTDYLATLF